MKKFLILSQDRELGKALGRAFHYVLGFEGETESKFKSLENYEVIICCCMSNLSLCDILERLAENINKFKPILFLTICFREHTKILSPLKATGKIDVFNPNFNIGKIKNLIEEAKEDYKEYCKYGGDFYLWKENLKWVCRAYYSHHYK